MASVYRLLINTGPLAGKAFAIEKGEVVIGRDLGNDITISDAEVSRRHFRLFLQGSNYVIEDMGSTNGTSVNGQRLIGPYILRGGEAITLGEHVGLTFEIIQSAPDPNATIAAGQARQAPPQAQRTPAAQQPPRPVSEPPAPKPKPPAPVYSKPAQTPPPAYQEQPYLAQAQPPQKKKFPTWLIILLVAIPLLIICACIGVLYYIDSKSLWCQVLPILPGCLTIG